MKECPRCHCPVDETDNYCRACGRSLRPGTGFLFTHSGIILLAVVLGPFALPVVWMSKLISTPANWIYTALLALLTVYLIHAFYQAYLLMQDAAQMMLGGGF